MNYSHRFLHIFLFLLFAFPAITSSGRVNGQTKPCETGPNIMKVMDVTPTSMTFVFHGVNVFKLKWSISGTRTLAQGVVEPSSPYIPISFNQLASGNYLLRLEGINCTGSSTLKFTIPQSVTRNNTASVRQASSQSVAPRVVTRGLDSQINIQITGSSENWILNDLTELEQPEGYEWWYFIGGHIVKTSTPLKNYPYQSNAPLRVLKLAGKKGLKSFSYWGDEIWQDKNAGWTMPGNSTAAFATFVFTGNNLPAGGQKTGQQVSFINPVPKDYFPDGFLQWAERFPAVHMPKGHIYHLRKSQKKWSYQMLLNKGITHLSNYDLPWDDHNEVIRLRNLGITYNDVPNNITIFNLPDSGTDNWVSPSLNKRHFPNGLFDEKTARQKARETDAEHYLWIGQTEENSAYVPADEPMWGWFYDELKKRYEQKSKESGKPYYIAHNYFWIGQPDAFVLGQTSREKSKALYTGKLPETRYSPGRTLASTNLIVEGAYINTPDQGLQLYRVLHKLNMFKKMGFAGGVFAFGVHEWRPNNFYRIDLEGEGTLYRQDKFPVDPGYLISLSFLSQVYGKAFFEWGSQTSASDQKKPMHPDMLDADKWYPAGSTQPQAFPWISQSDYYGIYTGSSDFIHMGAYLYSETFAKVDDAALQYCRFRVNNGKWIEPAKDGSDVVDAHFDNRPIVGTKIKGNKAAVFYINPYDNATKKQLEFQLPGRSEVYRTTVSGSGVHAVIFDL